MASIEKGKEKRKKKCEKNGDGKIREKRQGKAVLSGHRDNEKGTAATDGTPHRERKAREGKKKKKEMGKGVRESESKSQRQKLGPTNTPEDLEMRRRSGTRSGRSSDEDGNGRENQRGRPCGTKQEDLTKANAPVG